MHARDAAQAVAGAGAGMNRRGAFAVPDGFSQELRIATAGLEIGMFVSRLDRPWIGSGFTLEGVHVRTEEELASLRAMCRHVHVDLMRGTAPELRWVVLESDVEAAVESRPSASGAVPDRVFGAELARAEATHEQVETSIRDVLDEVRGGGRLDGEKLSQGVDALLESITRNPNALPWVMEMRRKGDYIYQHGLACAIWASTFGCHIGLERDDLRDLALGALLCDVGKIKLPTALLSRPPPLADHEWERLRGHVEASRRIVEATPNLSPIVLDIVSAHHERHDGSGYPRGLKGTEIPLLARIAGLVDSYDAMISVRPYAASRSPHQAVMELYETRDRLFQAELVEQFIRTCGIYPTGSLVELTDGSVGVVMEVNALKRLRPSVMLILGADKRPLADFRLVDLASTIEDADGQPLAVKGGLPQGAHGIDRSLLFLD